MCTLICSADAGPRMPQTEREEDEDDGAVPLACELKDERVRSL